MKAGLLKRAGLFVFPVIFFYSLVFSQYEKKVDGNKIKQYILTLSSDEYLGRETGTKGGVMAEDFFAKKYEELKLKPAGDNGTFYHTYAMPFSKIEGDIKLVVGDRVCYYGRNDDFTIERNSTGGKATGEIVFAGYGINNPDLKRNDFEGLDLKGKVVLIRRGAPRNELSKWKESAGDSTKAEYCYKNGAVGILFFESAGNVSPFQMNPPPPPNIPRSLSRFNPISNFPIFRLDEKIVRYIFDNMKPSYSNILSSMDQKTMSYKTGKNCTISAKIDFDVNRKVRNVLAMIPGTDSKLKNEAIIIGGHLDHLGIDANSKIYHGADDNASGPAVALGVAEAMIKNKIKPKRTIIFTGWSGEEEGLLGSAAWCKNPGWDLNKIVVYFNLDMVGLGENLSFPGIAFATEVWKFLKENIDSTYMKKINPSKGGLGGSDHTPFLQKGVPAFAGMTGGSHPDYHQPEDEGEKINAELLQFVGDYMYKCIELLANSKENFISENRNGRILFDIANVYNLALVPYTNYKNILAKKNLGLSMIDFSAGVSSENYEQNFLKILKTIDSANINNMENKEYSLIQNMNEARYMSYMNKSALVSAVDLSKIGYNELYLKTLAKNGLKFGYIKPNSPFAKNKPEDTKLLTRIMENKTAMILDNLPQEEISGILEVTDRPIAIQIKDLKGLNDEIVKKIKAKEHLVIYQVTEASKTPDIIAGIKELKNKIGASLISITLDEMNNSNYLKLKEIYLAIKNGDFPEELTEKIFNENISTFFTRATADKPQPMRGFF